MKLDRLTACTLFSIERPKWNGNVNRREVGLALNRVTKHNKIEFTYVRKRDGLKSIPDTYYFDGDKIKSIDYEIQNRYGLTLVIIPFTDLEVLN